MKEELPESWYCISEILDDEELNTRIQDSITILHHNGSNGQCIGYEDFTVAEAIFDLQERFDMVIEAHVDDEGHFEVRFYADEMGPEWPLSEESKRLLEAIAAGIPG